jgi:hypothetical protein
MRIFLATVAAAFLLAVAGQVPASAATAGQALIHKQDFGKANATVDKAGWQRRHWRHRYWRHRHRPWYRRWWW